MKRVSVIVLITLILLTACQQMSDQVQIDDSVIELIGEKKIDVTSLKRDDTTLKINGILYDILESHVSTHVYDSENNRIESNTHFDSFEHKTIRTFKDHQVILEEFYETEKLISKTYYKYDKNFLIEKTNVRTQSGLTTKSVFTQDETSEYAHHYTSNGDLSYTSKMVFDENGNKKVVTSSDKDGSLITKSHLFYQGDQLAFQVSISAEGAVQTSQYIYNTFGDAELIIRNNNDDWHYISYMEYDYDSNENPIKITRFEIRSKVSPNS